MKFIIKLIKTSIIIIIFFGIQIKGFSQAEDTLIMLFDETVKLNEGIYTSLQEIKSNSPVRVDFIKKGDQVYYSNVNDSIVELKPETVYGYSFNNNIYLSSENSFWRCVNLGSLTHFSEVITTTYIDYDSYSSVGYQKKVKQIRHNFLDMKTGEFKRLNYKNLQPYIEQEPTLKKYIKRNNKAKYSKVILVLRAYNELNPLYIPVYE